MFELFIKQFKKEEFQIPLFSSRISRSKICKIENLLMRNVQVLFLVCFLRSLFPLLNLRVLVIYISNLNLDLELCLIEIDPAVLFDSLTNIRRIMYSNPTFEFIII